MSLTKPFDGPRRKTESEAAEYLASSGIPGLRYLDGTSHKRAKAPTTSSSGIRKSSTASRCWSATAILDAIRAAEEYSLQPRRQPTLRRPAEVATIR